MCVMECTLYICVFVAIYYSLSWKKLNMQYSCWVRQWPATHNSPLVLELADHSWLRPCSVSHWFCYKQTTVCRMKRNHNRKVILVFKIHASQSQMCWGLQGTSRWCIISNTLKRANTEEEDVTREHFKSDKKRKSIWGQHC